MKCVIIPERYWQQYYQKNKDRIVLRPAPVIREEKEPKQTQQLDLFK